MTLYFLDHHNLKWLTLTVVCCDKMVRFSSDRINVYLPSLSVNVPVCGLRKIWTHRFVVLTCFSKCKLSCQEKAKVWVLMCETLFCSLELSMPLRCVLVLPWIFDCCEWFETPLSPAIFWVSIRAGQQLPLCPLVSRNIPDPNMRRYSFRRDKERWKIRRIKTRWVKLLLSSLHFSLVHVKIKRWSVSILHL